MEKIARVVNQSPLISRNWTNSRNESVVIRTVELELSDGIDNFVAEATDTLADQLNASPLSAGTVVCVQARLQVRRWTSSQSGTEQRATSVKLIKVCPL